VPDAIVPVAPLADSLERLVDAEDAKALRPQVAEEREQLYRLPIAPVRRVLALQEWRRIWTGYSRVIQCYHLPDKMTR
jgi:hypothetical protein